MKAVKKYKAAKGTNEIIDLFAMKPDFDIASKKYDIYMLQFSALIKTFEDFINNSDMHVLPRIFPHESDFAQFKSLKDRITRYKILMSHLSIKEDGGYDEKRFMKIYPALKKSVLLLDVLKLRIELLKYAAIYENASSLQYKPELVKETYFIPLGEFLKLDFTKVFETEFEGPEFKKFQNQVLVMLNKLLRITEVIYNTYDTPDLDPDRYIDSLTDVLHMLKKRMRRCGNALNSIINSLKKLSENFGDYYRDTLISGNSSSIATGFINDIIEERKRTSTKDSVVEFRMLSQFIKNNSPKDDPKVVKISSYINNFLDKIENQEKKDKAREERFVKAKAELRARRKNAEKKIKYGKGPIFEEYSKLAIEDKTSEILEDSKIDLESVEGEEKSDISSIMDILNDLK